MNSQWKEIKGDIREFLAHPKRVLVKPKDWDKLWKDEQKEWRSRRRWFVVQLMALVLSLALLVRTYL